MSIFLSKFVYILPSIMAAINNYAIDMATIGTVNTEEETRETIKLKYKKKG